MPTLFRRDPDDRRFVIPEVAPDCDWVVAGEGVATRQYDGVCVLYDPALTAAMVPPEPHDGALNGWWVRRKVAPGVELPLDFYEVESRGGRSVGWEPVDDVSRVARPLGEAVRALSGPPEPGSYELIGPRINRNPEQVPGHQLVRHADADIVDAPRDYEGLRVWLHQQPYEGIVWRHPDGRMVKIKRRDFPRA